MCGVSWKLASYSSSIWPPLSIMSVTDDVPVVQVTVYNLQGRNYVFRLAPTFRPVQPEACYAVASKTKKNVLLTIKVSIAPVVMLLMCTTCSNSHRAQHHRYAGPTVSLRDGCILCSFVDLHQTSG